MTPADPEQPGELSENGPAPAGPGKRLREARERQGLSISHVCESLHLDESIILALEQERFDSLGAPVYVRGHIKTYALLLGLPADDLAAAIPAGPSGPVVADALKRSGRTPFTVNPVLLIGVGAAILIGLMLALYVLLVPGEPAAPVARPAIVDAPADEEAAGVAGVDDE